MEAPASQARALASAVRSLSGNGVSLVHLAERPECYCPGEVALGLPWIGAECFTESRSSGAVGCPAGTSFAGTSTTGAKRRCTNNPDNSGRWVDVDTTRCRIGGMAGIVTSLNSTNLQQVLQRLLEASDGVKRNSSSARGSLPGGCSRLAAMQP